MKNNRSFLRKQRLEDYSYIVSKEQPLSFETENLQKAILNLEFANVDNKFKTIQITSTVKSEGKTTMLSNIAYLLTQRNKKVLIIDLDLRRPKLHHVSKVANENGLTDYLLGEKQLEEIISHNNVLEFDFIVAGQKTTAINNALNSDKLKNMLETLKDSYDYILIDTPPTFLVSDPFYISKIVDGVIYIIGQNIAKKKDVREGLSELKKIETPIIGAIISQVKMGKRQKYYYYE